LPLIVELAEVLGLYRVGPALLVLDRRISIILGGSHIIIARRGTHEGALVVLIGLIIELLVLLFFIGFPFLFAHAHKILPCAFL